MRGTALSLCLWLAAFSAASPVLAQETSKDTSKTPVKGITSWKESLDLGTDGSAKVTLDLVLSSWDSDSIDLPLAYSKPGALRVQSSDVAASAEIGKSGDVRVIKVKFDKPPPATKLTIGFTVKEFLDWKKARSPRGFYSLSYNFTNLTATNVGSYSLKLLIPGGYRVAQVTSSTPKLSGEDVVAPYNHSREGDRVAVFLRSPSVAAGKSAAIAFNIQPPGTHSFAVVLTAAVIAAISLYVKRGVLTSKDYVRQIGA